MPKIVLQTEEEKKRLISEGGLSGDTVYKQKRTLASFEAFLEDQGHVLDNVLLDNAQYVTLIFKKGFKGR